MSPAHLVKHVNNVTWTPCKCFICPYMKKAFY